MVEWRFVDSLYGPVKMGFLVRVLIMDLASRDETACSRD